MSDTLIVSGGGVITASSEDLLVAADRARTIAAELAGVADLLLRVARPGRLFALAMEASELAERLRTTSFRLVLTLDAYSLAEIAVASVAQSVAGHIAYWSGVLAPVALVITPTPIVVGALVWLAAGAPGAAGLIGRNRAALSDPGLVQALRIAAGSVDDAARGVLRVPLPLSQVADDRAAGLLGREAVARGLLGALPGPVPSGPVRLSVAGRRTVLPPDSLAELASRIPEARVGGPQLAVERYEGENGPVYALYLGGTVELDAEAGEEPWDLASNLAAIGGAPAHSVSAAAEALRAAGATASDPVVLVGYSQGGLIASRLAESGSFSVRGMVTVGSPGADIPPPAGVPVLAVEHTEDLVPALAGPVPAAGARVVVSRSLYDGRAPQSPVAVPAHELAEYRSTLALADRSEERRVTRTREEVLSVFPRFSGTASTWRAERTG